MWLIEAVDRSNTDISSVSFVTFNVAATFFRGHPYIWRTTVRHDSLLILTSVDASHFGASLSERYTTTWMGNSRYTLNHNSESILLFSAHAV